MLLIRDVHPNDLPGLRRLAATLDTVNLPDDEKALARIIERSVDSFSGAIEDPLRREYLFVLEEPETGELLGTSLIIAQHGTREAPHVYFEVSSRQTYSATIDRYFEHTVLSIAYDYDGPTEIGGLVVTPAARGKGKPGKQLSYVRFLFIGMHRENFCDHLLAELLPPLLPDGRSLLWESIGKKFTGLTYKEADRLSRQNKEFIKELFPQSDIWATLFPREVQEVIGQVGPQTLGVKTMLERIGFEYIEHIDPFDGGPHFEVPTDEVTLIQEMQHLRLAEGQPSSGAEERLVGIVCDRPGNRFRAVKARAEIEGERIRLPEEARRLLGVAEGDRVTTIPFP